MTSSQTSADQAVGPPFRLSTADLPEKDRLAIWREEYGRHVLKIEMEAVGPEPFHAAATILGLPGLRIAASESSGMRYRRTPLLASETEDAVGFVIANGRPLHTRRTDGGESEVSDGALAAFVWEPVEATVPLGGDLTTVIVPSRSLGIMLPDLADRMNQPIPARDQALRLLGRHVASLFAEPETLSGEAAVLVAGHAIDLVALALGAGGDAARLARERGGRAALLGAIKADIASAAERGRVSLARIAAAHGVSPRTVQGLFDAEGGSFSGFVRETRLRAAHRRLRDPRFSHLRISDIAFEAGFEDLSTFNRQFRRRFGMTPSDVRAGP